MRRGAGHVFGLLVLGLLTGGACTFNPPSSGSTASSSRVTVTEQPAQGMSSSSVWVISPVGLNVRSAPDLQAARLTTLDQSVRLNISERRTVSPDTWLHVKSEGGGVEGWVLDRPDLVIHRAVSLHVEQATGYSMLFPSDWSPVSGNPATFTGSSGRGGGSLLVQTSDDIAKLMPNPVSPGHELRQESPIEVYGRTTYITLYKLDAGGFEYDVKLQFPKSKAAYLFDFKQPDGADADTSLFKQLLTSVIVPGEG
ncbi:MAG TPA: SH3 domain-containing protein [Candidatus Dormibacteraeota bacterium]